MRRYPILALALVGCGVAAGSPTVTPVVSFRDLGLARDFTTIPDLTQPRDFTTPPGDFATGCPGDMAPPADLAHGIDLLAPPALSGNVNGIVVPAGSVYSLTGDISLTGNQSFTAGVYPGRRCTIIGNGHRFVTTSLSGSVKIRNCLLVGFGGTGDDSSGQSAFSFAATSGGDVVFDHNWLSSSGQVYVISSGTSTFAIDYNTFASDSITFMQDENVGSVYVNAFSAEGAGSALKYLRGNTFLRSGARIYSNGWQVGGYSEGEGNVSIAHRGAFQLFGTGNLTVVGNYSRPLVTATSNPDVENFSFQLSGMPNVVVEHNVVREGEWNFRGVVGETRYNWIVERDSHCMLCSADDNAHIHHNIISDSWKCGGNQEGLAEQIYARDGIVYNNNTFDGFDASNPGEASDAPFLHIYDGAVVLGSRSNLVTRMRRAAAAITRRYPGGLGPSSGAPGEARLLGSDYNGFFLSAGFPTFNGVMSIASNYGHGLAEQVWQYPSTATVAHCTASPGASDCQTSARCTERAAASGSCSAWGYHDLVSGSGVIDQQVDPQLRGPLGTAASCSYFENPSRIDLPSSFPFCLGPIASRAAGNETSDMLIYARQIYAPAPGSPLIGAGDPADGASNFIGAVGPGAGDVGPNDKLGLGLNQVPRLFLNATNLAAVRAKVAGNTAQWQAFKARLDANLDVVQGGSYQADVLLGIADYALGYQALRFSTPATAAKYADKALAILKSGLHDFQQLGFNAWQYAGRGDGSNRDFIIPDADFHAATLQVATCTVSAFPVTRSEARLWDDTGFAHEGWFFQKVSNSSDGTAAYSKSSDWQHNGDHGDVVDPGTGLPFFGNDLIDWSHAGSKPANGATYHLSGCSYQSLATTSAFSLIGQTVRFNVAPSLSTLVFWQYVTGTSSLFGDTLNYQQTSANEGGGLATVQVDSNYTSRYLGFIAFGLDSLDGYVGFSRSLKAEAADMLVRWSDWLKRYAYNGDHVARGDSCDLRNNYGVGNYRMRMWTAIALERRSGWQGFGPRLANDMADYYRRCFDQAGATLPVLGTAPSIAGGFWPGGYGYGTQALKGDLLTGWAAENAGYFTSTTAADVHTLANQIIEALPALSPTQSTVYDTGDIFVSAPYDPAAWPSKSLLYVAAAIASSSTDRAYANYMIQSFPGAHTADWEDLLYRDPSASATNVSALPLGYYAPGPGVIAARAAWDYISTWVSAQFGGTLLSDHEAYTVGFIGIQRGADDLLINRTFYENDFETHTRTERANELTLNDNGAGTQTYANNQGFFYGPGTACASVSPSAVDLQTNYSYASVEYSNAYCTPGGLKPATELRREWLYARPDYVIVHDAVTVPNGTYKQQLRTHYLGDPTLTGNGGVAARGGSKIWWKTFSNTTLTTAKTSRTVNGATTYEVISEPTGSSTPTELWTAFETSPSATGSMDATADVSEGSGTDRCLAIGTELACFTRAAAALSTAVTLSFTAPAGVTRVHITNVQPSRSYTLTGAASSPVTSSSNGVLELALSGAGGAVTVH